MKIVNKNGLSIIELVISLSILSIIILRISFSISIISDNLRTGSIDTNIYKKSDIFVEDSYFFQYNSGFVLTGALLLYNQSGGILIGTFKDNNLNYDFELASNEAIFSENYFGYFSIKEEVMTGIINNSQNIYSLKFNSGKVFKNLIAKDFNTVNYNSGKIFNINLDIFRGNFSKYEGINKNSIVIPKDDFIKFNFYF